MPSNTTRHRIPYPLTSERVADLPTIARQQAEKLDNLIPGENQIIINGTAYQLSGVFPSIPPFTLSGTSGVYVGAFSINTPYTPPAGYGFVVHVLETAGYTNVLVASQTASSIRVYVNQPGHSGSNNVLKKLGYRLVKTS